jgi:hypothetical protein
LLSQFGDAVIFVGEVVIALPQRVISRVATAYSAKGAVLPGETN